MRHHFVLVQLRYHDGHQLSFRAYVYTGGKMEALKVGSYSSLAAHHQKYEVT